MNVIGKASEWMDIELAGKDIHNPTLYRQSEETLRREYAYAGHLGLQALIVGLPISTRGQGLGVGLGHGLVVPLGHGLVVPLGHGLDNVPYFTRTLATLPASSVDVWIRLPYSARSWFVWDNIRHQSNSDKKLFLALEFTSLTSLRDEDCNAAQIEKWIAEPIKVSTHPLITHIPSHSPFNNTHFPIYLTTFSKHPLTHPLLHPLTYPLTHPSTPLLAKALVLWTRVFQYNKKGTRLILPGHSSPSSPPSLICSTHSLFLTHSPSLTVFPPLLHLDCPLPLSHALQPS